MASIAIVAHKIGIRIGNNSLNREFIEKLINNPGKMLAAIIIAGPIIEESLFQLIPHSLLNTKSNEVNWKMGIATSILFAAAHNFVRDSESKKLKFRTDKIPLMQFLGGLTSWEEMEKNGFINSVVRHSAYNSVPAIIAFTLGQYLKGVSQEEKEEILSYFDRKSEMS